MQDDTVGFWDHVISLRNHLLIGAGFFVVSASLIFAYGTGILISYLLAPLHGQDLVFLSPLGPFLFTLQVSLYAATAVSLPLWLGIVVHFISPALSRRKQIVSVLFIFVSLLLSASSLLIAYLYLIPVTLKFLLNFVVPGTSFLLTADSYISFFLLEFCVAWVILQIPIVIVLLAYMRVLNPHNIARHRRFLYLGLIILLAILTPTTDIVTLLVVSVPAILIAEIGILVAKRVYRKKPSNTLLSEDIE